VVPTSPVFTGATFEELFLTDSRSSTESLGTPPRIGTVVRRKSGGAGGRKSEPMVSRVVGDLFGAPGVGEAGVPAAQRGDSWSPRTSMLPPLDEENNFRSTSPTQFTSLIVNQEGDFPRSVTPTPVDTPNPNLLDLDEHPSPASNSTVEMTFAPNANALVESPKRARPSTPFLMATCPTPPSADRASFGRVRSDLLDSPPSPPRAQRGMRDSPAESHLNGEEEAEELDMAVRLQTRLSFQEERDYDSLRRYARNGGTQASSSSAASFASVRYGWPAPKTSRVQSLVSPYEILHGLPFPELVAHLLDQPRAPSPPRLSHLRPIYAHAPPSPSVASRKGKMCANNRPSLGPANHTLRNSESSSTLFSWDLAHLPAPGNPREEPFKVRRASVFLPTAFLGPTRFSGQFGDQYGPVERRVPKKQPRKGRGVSKPTAQVPWASEDSRPARGRGQSWGGWGWGSEPGRLERSTSKASSARVGGLRRSLRRSVLSLVGKKSEDGGEEGRAGEGLGQWVAVVLK